MSYKLKGDAGPTIVSEGYEYDVQTGAYVHVIDYEGSSKAILGLGQGAAGRKSHALELRGGAGRATFREPVHNLTPDYGSIRYEVASEVVEKEIWEHPTIIAAMDLYDGANPDEDTWREQAETAAKAGANYSLDPTWQEVVHMLKSGVTGWEKEYIVVRRTRKIANQDLQFPPPVVTNIANFDAMQYVYSTAQLLLPTQIAFTVPNSDTLVPSNAAYAFWGWRRRPSTVTYEGNFIEQSGEFLLAEWSSLLYTQSTVNASW